MPTSAPPAPRKALPVIEPTRCTGCGWCVAVCASHVLSLHAEGGRKTSTLDDAGGCTACALCALRCPFGAIRMQRLPRAGGAGAPAPGHQL